MEGKTPKWEELDRGVKILRFYKAKLTPEWPKIVILELSAEKFREFDDDILAFDAKYHLVPESPVSWASTCARPPRVKEVKSPSSTSRWMVTILKGGATRMCSAAYPLEES